MSRRQQASGWPLGWRRAGRLGRPGQGLGVATVDHTHRIIVEAQAHGTGSEQALLIPVVMAVRPLLTPETWVTAHARYHSEANLAQLATMQVTALIADNDLRRRDERVATQDRHHNAPDPLHDKTRTDVAPSIFQPRDFTHGAAARTCVCSAGKSLYRRGRNLVTNGCIAEHFRGANRDCAPCALRAHRLRRPDTTVTSQVAFFRGRVADVTVTHTARMKAAIGAPGRSRALRATCRGRGAGLWTPRHSQGGGLTFKDLLRRNIKITTRWTYSDQRALDSPAVGSTRLLASESVISNS